MEFSFRILMMAVLVMVVVLLIIALASGWSGEVTSTWGNFGQWFQDIIGGR